MSELSCDPLGRLLESRLGGIAKRESAREGTIRIIRENPDQLGRYRGTQLLGGPLEWRVRLHLR